MHVYIFYICVYLYMYRCAYVNVYACIYALVCIYASACSIHTPAVVV